MVDGIIYQRGFVLNDHELLSNILDTIDLDSGMKARKTASYGVAYNYSQMTYPDRPFLQPIADLTFQIKAAVGFEPNNCLINLYPDGNSAMGYHSDQVDILDDDTGIAIISLGAARTLRFRKIDDKQVTKDFVLQSGSLFYMTQDVQRLWQHAIPKTAVSDLRMSLTFRKIKR